MTGRRACPGSPSPQVPTSYLGRTHSPRTLWLPPPRDPSTMLSQPLARTHSPPEAKSMTLLLPRGEGMRAGHNETYVTSNAAIGSCAPKQASFLSGATARITCDARAYALASLESSLLDASHTGMPEHTLRTFGRECVPTRVAHAHGDGRCRTTRQQQSSLLPHGTLPEYGIGASPASSSALIPRLGCAMG